MIDYVKLIHNIDIPSNLFHPTWKKSKTDSGCPYRWRTIRGVKLRYYEESCNLTINGKILMLLHDTQVQNFDDIYGGRRDMFIDELNSFLNSLFQSPILDIREFKVTRIDYCFNVKTPYVHDYVAILSKAFQMTNSVTRKNFTSEKDLSGSVYVRTTTDYKDNTVRNYTLNFYDKEDRLNFQKNAGQNVSESDMVLARDIFRMEVQCGTAKIKSIEKKFDISSSFDDLFDFNVAFYTISSTYALIFKASEKIDFYTYSAAKSKVGDRGRTAEVLRIAASHRIVDRKYDYARNQIKAAGIYPHCFLPDGFPLPSLENPLRLIRKKLSPLNVLTIL